jgi:hypothetical protein
VGPWVQHLVRTGFRRVHVAILIDSGVMLYLGPLPGLDAESLRLPQCGTVRRAAAERCGWLLWRMTRPGGGGWVAGPQNTGPTSLWPQSTLLKLYNDVRSREDLSCGCDAAIARIPVEDI